MHVNLINKHKVTANIRIVYLIDELNGVANRLH
jgi:hypothetical protein